MRLEQIYRLQDEAVPEPGGAGTPARRQQLEQFVPLGVEVLHGWQLGPGDASGSFHRPM